MKVAYLCPMAHVTVIQWNEKEVQGKLPNVIQCSKLYCGCASHIFGETVMDESVVATHVFYRTPLPTEIVSLEEQAYLDKGLMMFREIEGNQPEENIKEFNATNAILKLASFLSPLIPLEERKDDIVDTAIDYINSLTSLKAKEIVKKMKVVKNADVN